MTDYDDYLARIKQSATELTPPPLHLVRMMFLLKKEQQAAQLNLLGHEAAAKERQAQDAFVRMTLRHEPHYCQRYDDYRDAITHKGEAK